MNEELTSAEIEHELSRLKWSKLIAKPVPFIVKMVVKHLRGKGMKFFRDEEPVEYEVVPVTRWPRETLVKHGTKLVYEIFRGYRGVILSEKTVNGAVTCRVRLRKEKGVTPFVTTILKTDLKQVE